VGRGVSWLRARLLKAQMLPAVSSNCTDATDIAAAALHSLITRPAQYEPPVPKAW
jgi:hypothetical protein